MAKMKRDSHGNLIFTPDQEVPFGGPAVFSRAEAAKYGIPEFGRIEIPLDGREQLRDYARELRELAHKMDVIANRLDEKDIFLVLQAWAEIRRTSNNMRYRGGPRK